MAYEPLHHKYRPKTFQDLVGQTAIAQTLSNAIIQRRIAPAYLFSGPRGTGKTSSARILAKSLNCQSGDQPTPQPCGTCEACHSITSGIALDVIEIDAASNTGVDNIRELIEKAQFAPVQCRYKVYVIDECHMLSTAAFNALLKTLEEPPDRVVFVLATTDPQRVLPTIISRCQRFDYRRIPLEEMVAHLRYIADQELIDIHGDALRLVGQLSQGGLRDSESLLDQLSLLPPPVAIEAVWDLVGAVPERDLLSLLEAIAANNAEGVLDRARQLMDRGREPLVVLQNLASFYRDLLVAKTAPQRNDLVAITPDTWAQMVQFSQQLDVATILQGQQHLRSSEVQLKNSTQPRLWLEVTLMGLLPAALVQPQGMAMMPANAAFSGIAAPGNSPAIAPPPVAYPVAPPAAPPVASGISAPIQVAAPPPPPAAVQAAAPLAETPALPSGAATQPPPTSPSSVSPPAAPPPAERPSVEQPSAERPSAEPTAPEGINLGETWKQVIANVEYRSTQMLLRQQSQLMRLVGGTAHIAVTQQWLSSIQSRQGAIEIALAKVLGRAVKIKLDPVQQKPEAPPVNAAPGSQSPGGSPAIQSAPAAPAAAPPAPTTVPSVQPPTVPSPVQPSPGQPPTVQPPTVQPQTAQPAASQGVANTPSQSNDAPAPTATARPTRSIDGSAVAPSVVKADEQTAPPSAIAAIAPESITPSLASTAPSPVADRRGTEAPANGIVPPASVAPPPEVEAPEPGADPMVGLAPLPSLLNPLVPGALSSLDSELPAVVEGSQAQLAPIGEAAVLSAPTQAIWEEDEIVRSAKQLAQFFNGEVVRDELALGDYPAHQDSVDLTAEPSHLSGIVAAIAPVNHSALVGTNSTEQPHSDSTFQSLSDDCLDEDDEVPF